LAGFILSAFTAARGWIFLGSKRSRYYISITIVKGTVVRKTCHFANPVPRGQQLSRNQTVAGIKGLAGLLAGGRFILAGHNKDVAKETKYPILGHIYRFW
jgi:hypothetical protein